MQSPRADVFHAIVDERRDSRDLTHAVFGEAERRSLGFHERDVLLGKRVFRLRHDPDKVRFRERLELHANREPSLELRDQVAGLGHVERARGDEQHVIGLHHAVLRLDVRALDDRQEIALHPFARHIRTAHL